MRMEAASRSRTGLAERATYPYDAFSELAGPLQEPPADGRVRFRPVARGWARFRAWLLVVGAFTFELVFLVWLLQPSHYPEFLGDWRSVLARVLLVSVGIIGVLQIVNVGTLALATLDARDPVPVTPLPDRRVAFLTTFVPGKEPLEMVRRTLEAAVKIRHRGPARRLAARRGRRPGRAAVCAELGVHHFTRKGVAPLEPAEGPHRARTKHGNYNAWLDAHGDDYDFFASVDTDHVPLPNILERMLGYFRDPDVAFVVGPQVYGNYDNVVTKAPSPSSSSSTRLIQRAGNRSARRCSSAPTTPSASRRSRHRRAVRLDHRGHGHRLRDAPPPATRRPAQVAVGLHPGRARRRRGARRLDGLLHPAAALGPRHVRDDPQAVLEAPSSAAGRQALQLHDDDDLLPDGGAQLDAGGAEPAPRS